MDRTNRHFDRLILSSKTKLISLEHEQEILKQIQGRDYANLPVLLESYSYSILKTMKLKLACEDYAESCMAFVKKEIKRLALMEKDVVTGEQFTRNVPWWINDAIEAFNNMKQPKPSKELYHVKARPITYF